jgi:hypothetical protein
VAGEMWLMDFNISSGSSPIVYSLALPLSKAYVKVLDCYEAYCTATNTFGGKESYFPVLREDWWTLVNWALAEPPESLTFQVMCTTLNRVRGGLALGANVIVNPMQLNSSDVKKIALAALLHVYQVSEMNLMIESNKDVKDAYKSNAKELGEKIIKYGIIAATGGLALPIYFAAKWLFTSNHKIDFVLDGAKPKLIKERVEQTCDKVCTETLLANTRFVAKKAPEAKRDCYLCEMQRMGSFSASGIAEEGQMFYCENNTKSNVRMVEFSVDETVRLLGTIRRAEEFHLAANAKVSKHINDFKHWLEAKSTIEHKFTCENIRGGPGTGKSTIIRVLAKKMQDAGKHVVITMPFAELQDDYVSTEVLGYKGLHTFEADTTYWTLQRVNVDVLIVDECSSVDSEVLLGMIAYLNVSHVILVGDKGQTCLNSAAGEGLACTASETFNMDDLPSHELYWNYRNKAGIVKYLNHKFKYRMCSRDNNYQPIKFYQAEEKYPKPDKYLVFAHMSAGPAFGLTSTQEKTKNSVNLSVRSSQGTTSQTAAISWADADLRVAQIHGMMTVAVSRSREVPYFVYTSPENLDDLKEHLCMSKPDQWEKVCNEPWPSKPRFSGNFVLSAEEDYINKWLIKQIDSGTGTVKVDESTTKFHQDKLVYEKNKPKDIVVKTIRDLDYSTDEVYETLRGLFGFCFFDEVKRQVPILKDEVNEAVLQVYYDNHMLSGNLKKFNRKVLQRVGNNRFVFTTSFVVNWAKSVGLDIFEKRKSSKTKKSHYVVSQEYCETSKVVVFLQRFVDEDRGSHVTAYEPEDTIVWHGENDHHVSKIHGFCCRRPIWNLNTGVKTIDGKKVSVRICEPTAPAKAALKPSIGGMHYAPEMQEYCTTGILDYEKDGVTPQFYYASSLDSVDIYDEHDMVNDGVELPTTSQPEPKVKTTAETMADEYRERHRQRQRRESDEVSVRSGQTNIGNTEFSRALINQTVRRCGTVNIARLVSGIAEPTLSTTTGAWLTGSAKPDYSRFEVPDFTRKELNYTTQVVQPLSSWKRSPFEFNPSNFFGNPHRATKNRAQTDGYKLDNLIDPTGAMLGWSNVNPHSATIGHDGKNNIKLNWEGFLFDRTKRGALKPRVQKEYFSILPGMALSFSNSPEETLTAAMRIGRKGRKPKLTLEAKQWAEKAANKYYDENFIDAPKFGVEEINYVLDGAYKAVKARNYVGRAMSELKKNPTGMPRIVLGNKSIVKFKNPLNPTKFGQALSMTPPGFNAKWVPYMRCVNTVNKLSAGSEMFFDDYEPADEFVKKLNLAIKGLPQAARFGISDARNFDSQQNEVTVYMEKIFVQRLLGKKFSRDDYYLIREDLPYIAFGLFSGKTNKEKGSGFPDTKFGNQTLAGILSNMRYTGLGPKVVGAKGDDYLRVQACLKIDEKAEKEIKLYTKMQLVAEIGDGGSFIGYSVNRKGCFVNIVQKTIKALASKARDYKHFCEQQIAYRDSIKFILSSGIEDTLSYGAEVCGYTANYAYTCFVVLNSLASLNKEQWQKRTKRRAETRFFLNKASGPTLI